MFHQIFKQGEFAPGIVITFQVMAFTGMSPGDPNAICTFSQGCQEEFGIHPSCAGDADDPDVGRILHPADPGKISGAITAPVAQKSRNFRFPFRHGYLSPFSGYWILVSGCWILYVSSKNAYIMYRVSKSTQPHSRKRFVKRFDHCRSLSNGWHQSGRMTRTDRNLCTSPD